MKGRKEVEEEKWMGKEMNAWERERSGEDHRRGE